MMQTPNGMRAGPEILNGRERGIGKGGEREKGLNGKEREVGGGHLQDRVHLGVETRKEKEIVIGTRVDNSVLVMAGVYFIC
jgi:hypothetical protein